MATSGKVLTNETCRLIWREDTDNTTTRSVNCVDVLLATFVTIEESLNQNDVDEDESPTLTLFDKSCVQKLRPNKKRWSDPVETNKLPLETNALIFKTKKKS